jgi:hypothetical protein
MDVDLWLKFPVGSEAATGWWQVLQRHTRHLFMFHRAGSLRHFLRHGHVACSFRPVRQRANRCKFELAAVSRGVPCTRAFTSAFKPRFRYYYAWSDSKAHIGSSFDVALRLSRDVFPASSSHMALLSPGVAYTPLLPAILILQPFRRFNLTTHQVLGWVQRVQDVVLAL